MWLSGTLTYGGVVILANVTILHSTSNHTIWSALINIASIWFFYLFFWFESTLSFIPELYQVYWFLGTSQQLIFYIIFMVLVVIVIEMAIDRLNGLYSSTHPVTSAQAKKQVNTPFSRKISSMSPHQRQ
jgi:hypothetical protein